MKSTVNNLLLKKGFMTLVLFPILSEFTFWAGEQSEPSEPAPDNDPGGWNFPSNQPEGRDSMTKEATHQLMKMKNTAENLSGGEHSGDFSGCTFESPAQLTPVSHPGNLTALPAISAGWADMRPEVFKETYPSIVKIVEVLESRARKSSDQEVSFSSIRLHHLLSFSSFNEI